MSRAAKTTLGISIVATIGIVTGVHYLQIKERETMYKGVERDEKRQQEKRQRMADLERNREREASLRQLQPIADTSSQRLT
ncbi:hypothetical protein MNAN1_003632 [Malassezia nana]|uniref:Cytochrome c oxidase assembly protein n=1 Tax=Malassezia nana TaxID=180528 RepID=A0AAF0EPN1_9BASI|nr:hypothetical protein MNAN1_003632 [Malassezia nana]